MGIAFAIFGVAYAASCVWLTVRIVNRGERWAKWTLAGAVGVPTLYVASFGPACWLGKQQLISLGNLQTAYWPMVVAAHENPSCNLALDNMASLFGCHREFFNVLYTDFDPDHELSGCVM